MAILREGDPRIGCLAIPVTAVAAFIVGALLAAAIGAGASTASLVGVAAMAGGIVVAAVVLRRTSGHPR